MKRRSSMKSVAAVALAAASGLRLPMPEETTLPKWEGVHLLPSKVMWAENADMQFSVYGTAVKSRIENGTRVIEDFSIEGVSINRVH